MVDTCQVAIEVEREEDEGGMVGETFTDYVSAVLFKPPSLSFIFFNVFFYQIQVSDLVC